jgi:toxin ParE1/3/4
VNTLVFRPSAEADLTAIALQIAVRNVERAEAVVERLRHRTQSLKSHPLIGRVRPEFGDDIRSLVERPYLILYRYLPGRPPSGTVEIVAVLHGARNLVAVMASRREPD